MNRFDEFWQIYPRKMGKHQARIAFGRLRDVEQQEVIERMPAFVEYYSNKQMKFVPYASTFLNQHRWEDEVESEVEGDIFDGL